MDFQEPKDRIQSIGEFHSEENKQDRAMSMREWNQSLGEPKIRDLWDTINIDLASGVRFYDGKTHEEITNPKDILNHFLFSHIIELANKITNGKTHYEQVPDLLLRFKSGCEAVDNMSLDEFLEWAEENYKKEQAESCDCGDEVPEKNKLN